MSTDAAATDPLAQLLKDLREGGVSAARSALERYEPYLRMAVRRRLSGPLRAKLDSMDVVQSIWADLLCGVEANDPSFRDPAQFRAFLVRVARNRLIDHHRKHHRALEKERPLDPSASGNLPRAKGPSPSEVAQAGELWEDLLRRCPPTHQTILRLKREGRSLAEIASAVGLHEGSVRRILYELARRMRTAPIRAN